MSCHQCCCRWTGQRASPSPSCNPPTPALCPWLCGRLQGGDWRLASGVLTRGGLRASVSPHEGRPSSASLQGGLTDKHTPGGAPCLSKQEVGQCDARKTIFPSPAFLLTISCHSPTQGCYPFSFWCFPNTPKLRLVNGTPQVPRSVNSPHLSLSQAAQAAVTQHHVLGV